MKKKSIVAIAIVFAFFMSVMFVLNPTTLQAKEILIRLAVPAPPGDFPLTAGAEDLAAKFNQRAK